MAETVEALIERMILAEEPFRSAGVGEAPLRVTSTSARTESDRALDEASTELARLAAMRSETLHAIEHIRSAITELDENIALAIDQGRDDEADSATARQSDLESQLRLLEVAFRASASKEAALTHRISALKSQSGAALSSYAADVQALCAVAERLK